MESKADTPSSKTEESLLPVKLEGQLIKETKQPLISLKRVDDLYPSLKKSLYVKVKRADKQESCHVYKKLPNGFIYLFPNMSGAGALFLHGTRIGHSHSDIKKVQCSSCKKTLSYSSFVRKHMLKHGFKKPFICSVCKTSFPDQVKLNSHLRSHIRRGRFVCSFCNISYRREKRLKEHMVMHSEQKPYCFACQRYYFCFRDLEYHRKIHRLQRPYICNICSASFKDEQRLKVHIYRKCLKTPVLYTCKFCKKTFSERDSLVKHERLHVPTVYRCEVCMIFFVKEEALVRHQCEHLRKALISKRCKELSEEENEQDNNNIINHERPVSNDHPEPLIEACNNFKQEIEEDKYCCNEDDCEKPIIVDDDIVIEKIILNENCESMYICSKCNKLFAARLRFERHLIKHRLKKLLKLEKKY